MAGQHIAVFTAKDSSIVWGETHYGTYVIGALVQRGDETMSAFVERVREKKTALSEQRGPTNRKQHYGVDHAIHAVLD